MQVTVWQCMSFKWAEFYDFPNYGDTVFSYAGFDRTCNVTMTYMIYSSWLHFDGSSWERETGYWKYPTPFSPESCPCTSPMAQLLRRSEKLEWMESIHSESIDAHFATTLAFWVRGLVHRILVKFRMFLFYGLVIECLCWLLYICHRDTGGASREKVGKSVLFSK